MDISAAVTGESFRPPQGHRRLKPVSFMSPSRQYSSKEKGGAILKDTPNWNQLTSSRLISSGNSRTQSVLQKDGYRALSRSQASLESNPGRRIVKVPSGPVLGTGHSFLQKLQADPVYRLQKPRPLKKQIAGNQRSALKPNLVGTSSQGMLKLDTCRNEVSQDHLVTLMPSSHRPSPTKPSESLRPLKRESNFLSRNKSHRGVGRLNTQSFNPVSFGQPSSFLKSTPSLNQATDSTGAATFYQSILQRPAYVSPQMFAHPSALQGDTEVIESCGVYPASRPLDEEHGALGSQLSEFDLKHPMEAKLSAHYLQIDTQIPTSGNLLNVQEMVQFQSVTCSIQSESDVFTDSKAVSPLLPRHQAPIYQQSNRKERAENLTTELTESQSMSQVVTSHFQRPKILGPSSTGQTRVFDLISMREYNMQATQQQQPAPILEENNNPQTSSAPVQQLSVVTVGPSQNSTAVFRGEVPSQRQSVLNVGQLTRSCVQSNEDLSVLEEARQPELTAEFDIANIPQTVLDTFSGNVGREETLTERYSFQANESTFQNQLEASPEKKSANATSARRKTSYRKHKASTLFAPERQFSKDLPKLGVGLARNKTNLLPVKMLHKMPGQSSTSAYSSNKYASVETLMKKTNQREIFFGKTQKDNPFSLANLIKSRKGLPISRAMRRGSSLQSLNQMPSEKEPSVVGDHLALPEQQVPQSLQQHLSTIRENETREQLPIYDELQHPEGLQKKVSKQAILWRTDDSPDGRSIMQSSMLLRHNSMMLANFQKQHQPFDTEQTEVSPEQDLASKPEQAAPKEDEGDPSSPPYRKTSLKQSLLDRANQNQAAASARRLFSSKGNDVDMQTIVDQSKKASLILKGKSDQRGNEKKTGSSFNSSCSDSSLKDDYQKPTVGFEEPASVRAVSAAAETKQQLSTSSPKIPLFSNARKMQLRPDSTLMTNEGESTMKQVNLISLKDPSRLRVLDGTLDNIPSKSTWLSPSVLPVIPDFQPACEDTNHSIASIGNPSALTLDKMTRPQHQVHPLDTHGLVSDFIESMNEVSRQRTDRIRKNKASDDQRIKKAQSKFDKTKKKVSVATPADSPPRSPSKEAEPKPFSQTLTHLKSTRELMKRHISVVPKSGRLSRLQSNPLKELVVNPEKEEEPIRKKPYIRRDSQRPLAEPISKTSVSSILKRKQFLARSISRRSGMSTLDVRAESKLDPNAGDCMKRRKQIMSDYERDGIPLEFPDAQPERHHQIPTVEPLDLSLIACKEIRETLRRKKYSCQTFSIVQTPKALKQGALFNLERELKQQSEARRTDLSFEAEREDKAHKLRIDMDQLLRENAIDFSACKQAEHRRQLKKRIHAFQSNFLELYSLLKFKMKVNPQMILHRRIFPCEPFEVRRSRKFFSLVEQGNIDAVNKILLEDPVLVFQFNELSQSALMIATKLNNTLMVRLLCKKYARVNFQDITGRTALHIAVIYELEDIVKVLLCYQADPSIEDNLGRTPLQLYEEEKPRCSNYRIVQWLKMIRQALYQVKIINAKWRIVARIKIEMFYNLKTKISATETLMERQVITEHLEDDPKDEKDKLKFDAIMESQRRPLPLAATACGPSRKLDIHRRIDLSYGKRDRQVSYWKREVLNVLDPTGSLCKDEVDLHFEFK